MRARLLAAQLDRANLTDAYLTKADLRGAYLTDANLSGARLSRADVTQARGITKEQLLAAKSLKGATMPDGRKYEAWLKGEVGSGEPLGERGHGREKDPWVINARPEAQCREENA